MANILIADDHSIVRTGIKMLVEKHFQFTFIDEAGNEMELVSCIKNRNYEIILLDINMPDTNFPGLMHWIATKAPESKVVVFTMHSEKLFGMLALKLGAWGFLTKNAKNEEIISAIQQVLQNRKYISQALAEIMVDTELNHFWENPLNSLSARELEIAMMLEKGKSLPKVCSELNIQYSTGNTYKRRIFEKLNVGSIFELSRLINDLAISR